MNAGPRMMRAEWALVVWLFLLAFVPVMLTANDYGPTYDEPHYVSAGVRYAEWWVEALRSPREALTRDAIAETWALNHEHPPLQKMKSGFSQRWLGAMLPGLMAARLPSAAWLALTVCAVYLFSRRVWGRRGALFGALALAWMPRVFAHAHFAALDAPIMAWFFITAVLMAEAMRRRSWGWAALAGAAFGIALLAKVNAFFLPVLLIPWALIWHRREWPKLVLALAVIGPAVFFAFWPWLWIAPVAHLREYLEFHLRHAAYNVWYLGRLYQHAPWHYPFVMTAVTTPALVMALAVGGMARCWPRRAWHSDRALLLFGLAIALLPSALPGSPKYNGERLFLPAFPFLAALVGGGFAWLQLRVMRLLRAEGLLSGLACAVLGLALLVPSRSVLQGTHPYQLAYYNALVGGTRGATERGFETIYWGQVYQEAPSFLNSVAEPNPRVLVIPRGVIYLLEFQQQAGALRPDVQFTGDEREAGAVDYVMFQAMQSDHTNLCWQLVQNEEPAWALRLSDGAALLLAYDREAVASALDRLAR